MEPLEWTLGGIALGSLVLTGYLLYRLLTNNKKIDEADEKVNRANLMLKQALEART